MLKGGNVKAERERTDGLFLRAPLLPTLQYESILRFVYACKVKKCQNEIYNKIYVCTNIIICNAIQTVEFQLFYVSETNVFHAY